MSPAKPSDKSFTELTKLVQVHQHPLPSVTVQPLNFHSQSRSQGESISAYVAELRKLSERCDFGASLFDMLRDRLVCCINDHRLQSRMLAEAAPLTFDKALGLAQAMEAAEHNVKEMRNASEAHVVSTQQGTGFGARCTGAPAMCFRCG